MMDMYVYISSWNNFGGDPGIGLYGYDPESGGLTFIKKVDEENACNATYADLDRKIIYFCNEVENLKGFQKGGGGRVLGYKILPDGTLEPFTEACTFCPSPSYVTLDATGKYMVVSNHSSFGAATTIDQDAYGNYFVKVIYDDAVVNLFEMNEDGSIGKMIDVARHYKSNESARQLHARPHCTVISPSGKLITVCDKGNDHIYMYTIDNARLKLCQIPYQDDPDSAPRYCVFHPKKPYLIVNHEGNSKLSSFKYDEDGHLELICEADILGDDYDEKNGHIEQQCLTIHPSGKYVYDAVHGTEEIAVCEIDEETGMLSLIQKQPVSQGVWVRGCTVSPDGRFLISTCMKSGDVETFRILPDGRLSPTGQIINQSAAAFITFVKV